MSAIEAGDMRKSVLFGTLAVALSSSAFAVAGSFDVDGAYAKWDESTLTVGNAKFSRTYRADGDHLKTVSFAPKAGRGILTRPAGKAAGALSIECERAAWSPVGETGLVVRVSIGGRKARLFVYPSVSGVLTFWEDSRELAPSRAKGPFRNDFQKLVTLARELPRRATAVTDALWLDSSAYYRVMSYELFDQTDSRNDLLQTRSWLVPSAEMPTEVRCSSLDVRNIATDEGVVFLRLAPMPVSRPRSTADFVIDPSGAGVMPLDNGYALAELAYGGGELGRIAALQDFQRAIRPYRPGRDGIFLSNTWGDGNRDTRINADFMMREVAAAAELGVDVIQVDDGWQRGRTSNSGKQAIPGIPKTWGSYWDVDPDFWTPDLERFPNGLKPLADAANAKGIVFGLWFGPDSTDDLKYWERDADLLLKYFRECNVRYYKIDSLIIKNETGLARNRRFYDKVLRESNGEVVFDLDCTAGIRPGFFGMPDIGPLFVENRYAWKSERRYRPHYTLRNLWNLSQVIDPLRLRMELLNPGKKQEFYAGDPLAPTNYPPDTLFAITMMASPLGWMELSDIPADVMAAWKPLVATWKRERAAMHGGTILPIGDEPDGWSWTGFASKAKTGRGGYVLAFREKNAEPSHVFDLHTLFGRDVEAVMPLGGRGKATFAGGFLKVEIPFELDFLWVKIF